MAKQNITLKIIGKPYSLAIDSEKEELYRLAEREINAYVTRIEQAHFKGFSKEDCLAMAAFQIAVAKLAQSREVGDEDVKTLSALGDEVERYFDSLR
jgi:cell division protein ZapA (FtsZ GTPase activity inhibitor)